MKRTLLVVLAALSLLMLAGCAGFGNTGYAVASRSFSALYGRRTAFRVVQTVDLDATVVGSDWEHSSTVVVTSQIDSTDFYFDMTVAGPETTATDVFLRQGEDYLRYEVDGDLLFLSRLDADGFKRTTGWSEGAAAVPLAEFLALDDVVGTADGSYHFRVGLDAASGIGATLATTLAAATGRPREEFQDHVAALAVAFDLGAATVTAVSSLPDVPVAIDGIDFVIDLRITTTLTCLRAVERIDFSLFRVSLPPEPALATDAHGAGEEIAGFVPGGMRSGYVLVHLEAGRYDVAVTRVEGSQQYAELVVYDAGLARVNDVVDASRFTAATAGDYYVKITSNSAVCDVRIVVTRLGD